MSYHLDDNPLDKIFRRAVSRSCAEWGWDESQYADDLVQDLWVWFLERPSVQNQFAELMGSGETALVRELCFKAAEQLMSQDLHERNLFEEKTLYSSDSVRESLRGQSTNKYLNEMLPWALEAVARHNPGYGEAVKERYVDGVNHPPGSAKQQRLVRAVKSLTEEINAMYIGDSGGGRNAVYPDIRKQTSKHGDPTGDTALALIAYGDDPIEFVDDDQNPISLVDETGIPQATTTYRQEFLDVQHFRSAFQRHARVRDVPRSGRPRAVAAPEADVG